MAARGPCPTSRSSQSTILISLYNHATVALSDVSTDNSTAQSESSFFLAWSEMLLCLFAACETAAHEGVRLRQKECTSRQFDWIPHVPFAGQSNLTAVFAAAPSWRRTGYPETLRMARVEVRYGVFKLTVSAVHYLSK